MKSNFLPPPPLVHNSLRKVLMVCVVFLSTFHIAKADPNIEAQIIDVQNPDNFCSGATVIASIAPSWVPGTYDAFRIESAVLYLREDMGGGVYNDKPIASVGQQPDGEVHIEFSPVYGIGYLKVEITYYAYAGSSGGTFTDVSNFYSSGFLLSSIAPAINSFGVLNTATPNTNPYDLAGCLASGYDLDLDFDYVYGSNSYGTAITFEMFEVNGCSDPMGSGNRVVVEEFTEDVSPGESVEEYKDRLNDAFKSFVSNNTGHFRVRLTIDATDCGPARTADFCIHITNTPSNADFLITGCTTDPFNPAPPFSPVHTLTSVPVTGGATAAINGNLSSGDFSYYRFKLEIDDNFDNVFDPVPLHPDYGTNQSVVLDPNNPRKPTNLSIGINGMIDPAYSSTYNIVANPNVNYKITLYLGSDCGEVSEFSYFKTTSSCSWKSAEASASVNKGDKISIYPLPAYGQLYVDVQGYTHTSYELSNIGGQRILSGVLMEGGETGINVSTLASGIYFLRVIDGNGSVLKTEKVTVR